MSLHDVDKNNQDRSVPKPNQSDQLIDGARSNHGTNSINYTTDATQDPVDNTTPGGGPGVKLGFKHLVLVLPIGIESDGSSLTTAYAPHGLTYVPKVEIDLENATVSTAIGDVTGVTMPGPLFLDADIGTDVTGVVTFNNWLYGFADATNVYVQMLNATGNPRSAQVTCYLYRSAGL